MGNLQYFTSLIFSFMGSFISTVRSHSQFTYGFFTVNYFDILVGFLLVAIFLNVFWKGGKA